MPKKKKPFGPQLRTVREAAGLSQAELADCLDVSQNFVSQLECGGKSPSVHRLISICNALGVSLVVDDTVGLTLRRE